MEYYDKKLTGEEWTTQFYAWLGEREAARKQAQQELIEDCRCVTFGQDDGETTCFVHHDCSDGSCTHQDGDDDDYELNYED